MTARASANRVFTVAPFLTRSLRRRESGRARPGRDERGLAARWGVEDEEADLVFGYMDRAVEANEVPARVSAPPRPSARFSSSCARPWRRGEETLRRGSSAHPRRYDGVGSLETVRTSDFAEAARTDWVGGRAVAPHPPPSSMSLERAVAGVSSICLGAPFRTSETTTVTRSTLPSFRTAWTSRPRSTNPRPRPKPVWLARGISAEIDRRRP